MLYRLELASWNASDMITSVTGMPSLDSIRGYLSYRQGNNYNTIFYGGEKNDRIYGHFVFDSLCTVETAVVDLMPRNTGSREKPVIALRENAGERIGRNDGEFFEVFEKTMFNLIPVVTEKERKVVVLTGPQETGNVLFGNDYVLHYDAENKFKSQTKLHRNLITVPMEAQSERGNVFASIHSHASPTSEYITSTDICTLLLYGEYTNWTQHYVISDKFVSIWDLQKRSLEMMSRKAWDKIYNQTKEKTKE
jgi:hypothetical protein